MSLGLALRAAVATVTATLMAGTGRMEQREPTRSYIVQAASTEHAAQYVLSVGGEMQRPLAIINGVEALLTDSERESLQRAQPQLRVADNSRSNKASARARKDQKTLSTVTRLSRPVPTRQALTPLPPTRPERRPCKPRAATRSRPIWSPPMPCTIRASKAWVSRLPSSIQACGNCPGWSLPTSIPHGCSPLTAYCRSRVQRGENWCH